MKDIHNINFVTDDGETITVFISESLCDISNEDKVTLQVPVQAGDRWGHLYFTDQEVHVMSKTPVVRRALEWAMKTRAI